MELITRITKLIPVGGIYLSRFQYQETSFEELTILIPNSSKMHVAEARPLVNMVMAGHPEYRFRLFYLQEVKQALKRGSIVFYTLCREENLIWQLPGSNLVLMEPGLTAKAVLAKVKRNFKKELKRVAGFKQGAAFYLKQADYAMSAFMLHQVMSNSPAARNRKAPSIKGGKPARAFWIKK